MIEEHVADLVEDDVFLVGPGSALLVEDVVVGVCGDPQSACPGRNGLEGKRVKVERTPAMCHEMPTQRLQGVGVR
ncbi:hypothetical protein GCM10019016_010350 [Streptomyces prasinosporus]|uniref:Uncharacterized protein n=1 Tax=Streptomyces prasinosporus TaxID=68256 RepID=A0ABP6THE4_9ACTN